jgi:hypothetical protein
MVLTRTLTFAMGLSVMGDRFIPPIFCKLETRVPEPRGMGGLG